MNQRHITPKPFAAVLSKAAAMLDIGATSVSRVPVRHRVVYHATGNAQQGVAKDWSAVGKELFQVTAGETAAK